MPIYRRNQLGADKPVCNNLWAGGTTCDDLPPREIVIVIDPRQPVQPVIPKPAQQPIPADNLIFGFEPTTVLIAAVVVGGGLYFLSQGSK